MLSFSFFCSTSAGLGGLCLFPCFRFEAGRPDQGYQLFFAVHSIADLVAIGIARDHDIPATGHVWFETTKNIIA